jgi:hypothetical protein
MTQPGKGALDASALLLLGGAALAVAAYFMPSVSFYGRPGAVHDLSVFEKVPMLSSLAFAVLAGAVACRFVPALSRWSRDATVVAAIAVAVPALLGFYAALDAWSGLRATMLEMAGTRSVTVNPHWGFLPLLASSALIAASLHLPRRAAAEPA